MAASTPQTEADLALMGVTDPAEVARILAGQAEGQVQGEVQDGEQEVRGPVEDAPQLPTASQGGWRFISSGGSFGRSTIRR